MSRAILIEDRSERQRIFLHRKNVELDDFDVLRNICGGNEPERFKTDFFNEERIREELSDFDVVMTHRSAWSPEVRMSLREFCEKEQKALVYFSGGISSTTFYQQKEYQFLTMNSGDFYGANLKLFLESLEDESPVNLRILAFGDNWKFELLAKLRMKLSNALETFILPANEEKRLDEQTSVNLFRTSFGLDDEYLDDLIFKSEEGEDLKEELNGIWVAKPNELVHKLLTVIKHEMQQLGFA